MLIIRKEQIQHLIAADDGQLVKVIRQAIRQANTERVYSWEDQELENMVKIGIDRAKSHGLDAAEDIAAFVAVMFEIAPRFDEQDEIRQVLDDQMFTPDVRFYQLFERVSNEAWSEAEMLYEESFWFPAKNRAK